MWPQQWKASASPGLTTLDTALAAVAANSASPTLASSPRREVRAASSSSMDRLERAAFGRADHALELGEPVERALGEDDPVARIEGDRVRRARDLRGGPGLGMALLVEDLDRQPRLGGEQRDRRRDRRAQRAALGGEHGEGEARLGRRSEALGQLARLAQRRALV